MKQEKQPKIINEKADARQATFCMKCHCTVHKCWRRSWSRATCGHILPSMRACTCQHSYCKSNLDRSMCCPSRPFCHRCNLLHRPSWSHCQRHSRELHLSASSKRKRWSTRLSLRNAVSQKCHSVWAESADSKLGYRHSSELILLVSPWFFWPKWLYTAGHFISFTVQDLALQPHINTRISTCRTRQQPLEAHLLPSAQVTFWCDPNWDQTRTR